MYVPHHTPPGKIQYHTDGKIRILPTNFVPVLCGIFMFEMSWVGSVVEIVSYVYVGLEG